ncbi:MAG: GAF domain-containing protein [Candidatus Cybelea sp.]
MDDVDAFADHIVCDSASRSEIVVPILRDGELFGVFDVDSPVAARFTPRDRAGLERLVAAFEQMPNGQAGQK